MKLHPERFVYIKERSVLFIFIGTGFGGSDEFCALCNGRRHVDDLLFVLFIGFVGVVVAIELNEPESEKKLLELIKCEILSLQTMLYRIKCIDEEPWCDLGFRKLRVNYSTPIQRRCDGILPFH